MLLVLPLLVLPCRKTSDKKILSIICTSITLIEEKTLSTNSSKLGDADVKKTNTSVNREGVVTCSMTLLTSCL